jgi:hypothetical protein
VLSDQRPTHRWRLATVSPRRALIHTSAMGFVNDLSRPGGNATGFINIEASVAGKWLELLKQVAPDTSRFLVIFNPTTAPQSPYYLKQLVAAAPTFSLTPTVVNVSTPGEIDLAIGEFVKTPGGGLVITPDLFTASRSQRDQIVALAHTTVFLRSTAQRCLLKRAISSPTAPITPTLNGARRPMSTGS